jgi:hypothetical protein
MYANNLLNFRVLTLEPPTEEDTHIRILTQVKSEMTSAYDSQRHLRLKTPAAAGNELRPWVGCECVWWSNAVDRTSLLVLHTTSLDLNSATVRSAQIGEVCSSSVAEHSDIFSSK